MTTYIAIDSSLSMRLPVDKSNGAMSRFEYARRLAVQTVKLLLEAGYDRAIKLVHFSHNSCVLLKDVRSADEVAKKLDSINASASADFLSLYSLMRMENVDKSCTLLVFTDASVYTPEEESYYHLPNCAIRFVIVLDKCETNGDQLGRFMVTSARTCDCGNPSPSNSRSIMPFFKSDYKDLDEFSSALKECLCPSMNFHLRCGNLEAQIKLLPAVNSTDWDEYFEIIGFTSIQNMANAPTIEHHFIVGKRGEADNELLYMIASALRSEDSVALCRVGEKQYGTLSHYSAKDDTGQQQRLLLSLFPYGLKSVPWLPNLDVINTTTIEDGEEPILSLKTDDLPKASYANPPVLRACWDEAHGLQSDVQKILRLMRKIPEKVSSFYSEVNRFYMYCCALGAEDILEKVTKLIENDAATLSPVIRSHCDYVCNKFRTCGVKTTAEIQPLMT